jgi:hypothetical protein
MTRAGRQPSGPDAKGIAVVKALAPVAFKIVLRGRIGRRLRLSVG